MNKYSPKKPYTDQYTTYIETNISKKTSQNLFNQPIYRYTPNIFQVDHKEKQKVTYSTTDNPEASLKKSINNSSLALRSLKKKDEDVNLIKKKLSALLVKDEKMKNKIINTHKKVNQQERVKEWSIEEDMLVNKIRNKEQSTLKKMKEEILNTKMNNYYKTKFQNAKQTERKHVESLKNRQRRLKNEEMIKKEREEQACRKKELKRTISESSRLSTISRTHYFQARKQIIKSNERAESQAIRKMELRKQRQLKQLSSLEMRLLESQNHSRLVFESAIKKLNRVSLPPDSEDESDRSIQKTPIRTFRRQSLQRIIKNKWLNL